MPEEAITEITEEAEAVSAPEEKAPKHENTLMEWRAPEFIHHPKGKRWFLMAGVTILILIIYALYTNSATMAIVFLVLAGVYYMTHNQEAPIINIKITNLGIYAGQNYYPYNSIEVFWINYQPNIVHTLNLKIHNVNSKVVIQLHDQDPTQVRKLLEGEINEAKGMQEGWLDIIERLFRL